MKKEIRMETKSKNIGHTQQGTKKNTTIQQKKTRRDEHKGQQHQRVVVSKKNKSGKGNNRIKGTVRITKEIREKREGNYKNNRKELEMESNMKPRKGK